MDRRGNQNARCTWPCSFERKRNVRQCTFANITKSQSFDVHKDVYDTKFKMTKDELQMLNIGQILNDTNYKGDCLFAEA